MDERATTFFQCRDCPKSFSKRMDYNRHRKNHDKPFSCILCGHKSGLKTGLERHRSTHLYQTAGLKCTFPGCKSATSRKDFLWQHIKNKHLSSDEEDPEQVLRPYYHMALSNEKVSKARDDIRNLEFLEAVYQGEEDKVKDLIRDGVSISTKMRLPHRIQDAAKVALENRHLGVLKSLVEAGLKLRTGPIHEAAKRGRVEMVEFLLDVGVDIESDNPYLYTFPTVLSTAAIFGQISTAQMLLNRGAKLDAPKQVENLFIHGHVDVVRRFALREFYCPQTYAFGATMLHLVAVKHDCLIEELIDRGFDINAKYLEGRTPLSYALGRHPFKAQAGMINERAVGLLLYESEVLEADIAAMPPELHDEYDNWCGRRRRMYGKVNKTDGQVAGGLNRFGRPGMV